MDFSRPLAPPLTAPSFLVTREGAPGLTPEQVRHPRFAVPTRGVRLREGVALTPGVRDEAVLHAAPEPAVLSDLSAARFWRLPLPPWLAERELSAVAVPAGQQRQRRQGVRGRRLTLPSTHVVVMRGVRVTNPARTWVDCAAEIPPPHLLAMGDALLRRRLASPDEVSSMVGWARGRRGVVSARAVLPLLNPASESPPESLVRYHLVADGLPTPQCHVEIIDDGEWLARADLAWFEAKVIVEYDGAVHLSEEQRRHDAVRRNLLQDRGWWVLVFTARDLQHVSQMVDLVRSALHARGLIG